MGVNYLGLVIGPPQQGKTSLAVELAQDRLRRSYRVFAHDVSHQYRFLPHYENAAAWAAAAAAAARSKSPLHRGASLGGAADDMSALVSGIGKKSNRADRVLVPMFAIYDESSLLGSSGSSWLSTGDNALISTRRHLGVELLFLLQYAAQLHTAFLELATDVYLFRQSEQRLPALEEKLHLRRGELAALASSPPHRYVHVQPGRGVVPA